jgi:hypothetical protein
MVEIPDFSLFGMVWQCTGSREWQAMYSYLFMPFPQMFSSHALPPPSPLSPPPPVIHLLLPLLHPPVTL